MRTACVNVSLDDLTPADRAEILAFQRFLERMPRPRVPGEPATVLAVDHWDYDYIMGGPTPPLRWEGDDS